MRCDAKKKVTAVVIVTIMAAIFLSGPSAAQKVALSQDELTAIGEKIFYNECGGKAEGLVAWNEGEGFLSVGIGHFIWYPAAYHGRFKESFPLLLEFFKSRKIMLPAWLGVSPSPPCPWATREELERDKYSPRWRSLFELMSRTKADQVAFMVRRVEEALPAMLTAEPLEKRPRIEKLFSRLANLPGGWYALIDYVNFKGEGVKPREQYGGFGWGLLQVLEEMDEKTLDSGLLAEFSRAADFVLTRRVQYAPPGSNEGRWLPGWRNRVATYAHAP